MDFPLRCGGDADLCIVRWRWWAEVFMCAQLSQPVAHSLLGQVSLERPLRAFVKSWGLFYPHFYLLRKTKKPRDAWETIWRQWCQPLLLKCKANNLKANWLLRASSAFWYLRATINKWPSSPSTPIRKACKARSTHPQEHMHLSGQSPWADPLPESVRCPLTEECAL